MLLAVLFFAAVAAVCSLVAMIFHLRGNAKGEAIATEAVKVATDIEQAIPAGTTAVLAVLASDLETEIEKVAPDSSIAAMFVRMKAAMKVAGIVSTMALVLLLVGCTSDTVVRSAIDASNAASKIETTVAPDLESECVTPMRAADAVGKAALAKTCDPKVGAYAGERRTHLLLNAAIVAAESGNGVTVGEMLSLVHQLAESVATLVTEYTR